MLKDNILCQSLVSQSESEREVGGGNLLCQTGVSCVADWSFIEDSLASVHCCLTCLGDVVLRCVQSSLSEKCQWCYWASVPWWWLEQFRQVVISGWTFRHGTVHSPSQQLPGCTSRTLHRFSTARLTTIGSASSSTTSHEANIHPPSEQQYRLTGRKTPSYLLTEEHPAMISVLHVHCATD